MYIFFIADEKTLGKNKIIQIIEKKKFSYVVLRNRNAVIDKDIVNFCHKKKKKFIVSPEVVGYKKASGIHYSLFYDKVVSKKGRIHSKGKKQKISCAAHKIIDIVKLIKRYNFNFIFLSPIFSTKTHKEQKGLGLIKTFKIINTFNLQSFILLGGMTEKYYKKIKRLDFYSKIKGFASIRQFLD